MLEILNQFFPTLVSKTFFILIMSFASTCLGMISTYLYFSFLTKDPTKGPFTSSIKKNKGHISMKIKKNFSFSSMGLFWTTLGVNIVSVILLIMIGGSSFISLVLLFLFTYTEGVLLGVIVLPIAFIAIFAFLITIIVAVLTGLFGYFTNINFEFLGGFLFVGLILLLIISIFRIFRKVGGAKAKLIATFGILVFAGYIIYDFNNLKKLGKLEKFNNWETAIQSSTNLYLDIINLFLYILDLLTDS